MSDEFRIADTEERIVQNTEVDQQWADWLSPSRRSFLFGAGAAAIGLVAGAEHAHGEEPEFSFKPIIPPPDSGKSPWGYETAKEATIQPKSIWPGLENGLPSKPRPYTEIKSYHAHFYFNEDSYQKAALIRRWVAERFPVELGNWNLGPRGPHVTPSFYFGFTNDLLPILIPWLQLNSLGLTTLVHPNTDDPRADHLYYTLWVNRSQPVNAWDWKPKGDPGAEPVEKILPNIRPTVKLEI